MDLHGQIMNIQIPNDILGVFEGVLEPARRNELQDIRLSFDALADLGGKPADGRQEALNQLLMLAFKVGHKTARHEAAELVVTQGIIR